MIGMSPSKGILNAWKITRLLILGAFHQQLRRQVRRQAEDEDVDHHPGDDLIDPVLDGQHGKRPPQHRPAGGGGEDADPRTDRGPDHGTDEGPVSSIPSMPMLMTATRSHITPDNAPNVMGTPVDGRLVNIPTMLNPARPAAAQARKVRMNNTRAPARTRLVHLPKPRESWMPPRNARNAATT